MRFSGRELVDLVIAWVVLGVAFTVFFFRPSPESPVLLTLFGISMATGGVAFLLHELAHKVVAIRFGQVAEFRADYEMLFLTVMSAFAGFLFAAPGAVVHRGRITLRENGLIALAGPVTNLLLAAVFAAATLGPPSITGLARLGVAINLILAAFNMVPYGPLDGKTVYRWNRAIFAAVFLPSLALALGVIFGVGGFGL